MKKHVCLAGILICFTTTVFSQQFDSTLDKIAQFPNHLFSKIKNKTSRLDEQLSNQTEKYLKRMARKEAALEQKLNASDSVKAKQLFSGVQDRYIYYEQKLEAVNGTEKKIISGQYFPFIDSLKGALSFVQGNQRLLNISPEIENIAASSLGQFNQLMAKIQLSSWIKENISLKTRSPI